MFARASRMPLASVAVLALALGLAPIVEPPARGVDPATAPSTVQVAAATPTPTPVPTPTPTPAPPIGSPDSPMSRHLSGDVYGYLPYWEMNSATLDYLDYNALSVIGLFSVTSTATGTVDRTQPGYRAIVGSIGKAVIAAAKARGVRVEITFTSFGLAKNAAFFADPALRASMIGELRSLVRGTGAQGVSVDVELISGTWFDEYGAFLASLRAALRADNPTATVSVATNGNTSGARMAKRAADAGVDRIFIMGYSYRSAGSNPGAIAPLVGRSTPSGLDIRWSIDRYVAEGVPLGRVLLGLPYYGMTWPTVSSELGAARTTGGTTWTPRKNIGKPASLGVPLRYEPGESVSWYAWYDAAASPPTWRQVFFDTPTSLRPKYAYAISRRLAGVGIWALGFDRGLPGYWDLLKTMFGPPRVASFTLDPVLTRSMSVAAGVTATAGSRAVSDVRFRLPGGAWGPWRPLGAAGAGVTGGAPASTFALTMAPTTRDGSRRFDVQVRDEGGTRSVARSASVVVDRTGPVLGTAPRLWYSTALRTWRTRWIAATDRHGPVRYKVWYRINSGPWKVAVVRTSKTALNLPVSSRRVHVTVRVRPVDVLGNWGRFRLTTR